MSDPAASPYYRTGKICYLEIPATDVAVSAQFYQRVFGWSVRERDDGSAAFDDTVGGVSGTWIPGRPPAAAGATTGIHVHIMVADVAATCAAIIAAGGAIVQPVDPDAGELYALFSDPAGNVLGAYQQPGLAETEAALARQTAGDR